MKGKLTEYGSLKIYRGGKWKHQACPYGGHQTDGDPVAWCGDWCPLFGEPHDNYNGEVRLKLCQDRELFFELFADERGRE